MKRIALVALVAGGLLAAAGAVQAKQVMSLKVCGVSGCKETADRDALKSWWTEGTIDPAQVSKTSPAPFYTLVLGFGDGQQVVHTEQAYWLPDSGVMRYKESAQTLISWWKLLPNQRDLLRGTASGIDPFIPRVKSVTVKGKKVSDPASYLRLFGKLPFTFYPKGRYVPIVVRAAAATPWMGRIERLSYQPGSRILVRADGPVRLSKAMGKQVTRRASLAVTSASASSGHTALYAGIGVAGAAAVGLLLVAGRRKARDS